MASVVRRGRGSGTEMEVKRGRREERKRKKKKEKKKAKNNNNKRNEKGLVGDGFGDDWGKGLKEWADVGRPQWGL